MHIRLIRIATVAALSTALVAGSAASALAASGVGAGGTPSGAAGQAAAQALTQSGQAPGVVPHSSDAVADIYHQVLLKHTVWAEQQWSPDIQAYSFADYRFDVVLGNAVLLEEPDKYDAKTAGVSYDTLLDHTVKTITYYAANNLFTGGTKWGKKLFWDSTYETYFILAAQLMWDHLDAATHANIEKMAVGQADYTLSLGTKDDPLSGSWTPNGLTGGYAGDTKAEEMGVYAQSIAPAAAWYQDNVDAKQWQDRMGLWSRNMTSMHPADLANPATIDGVPIADNTANNVWDTFLVENHDSFEPHYQEEVWRTSGRNAIHFLLAGKPLPQELITQPNGNELLATILRTMSDAGEPLMPMIDDRLHLYGRDVLPLAYLSQVQGNAYAARAEQDLAERLLPYQDYGEAPRVAKFSGEPKYETEARAEIGIAYLFHQYRNASSAGHVTPVSEDQLFAAGSGVVDYGDSEPGLIAQQSQNAWAGVTDRVKKQMTKFAWEPEHDDWLFDISGTTPSFLPQPSTTVDGRKASVYTNAKNGYDGSATMLDLPSGYAGMTTLPTGSVVYASSGTAPNEGSLSLYNLTMPGVRGLDGTRDYTTADGTFTSHDTTPAPAPAKPANVTRLDTVNLAGVNARYVRIQGVQPATPDGYSLFEVQLRAGNDATNLAAGAKVTASSQAPDHSAANVTDGDTDTSWSVAADQAGTADSWVQLDLGKAKQLDTAYLYWDKAVGQQYVVQTSTDGTTWTDAAYQSSVPGVKRAEQVNFAPMKARYLRMQGLDATTEYGYSLYEFEARDGATGPNLATAPGAKVTASSQDDSKPASAVADGKYTTRWAVSNADRSKQDSWVQLDLGKQTTVDNVRLFWEDATAGAYTIEASTDGQHWTEVAMQAPAMSRFDDLSFASRDARYVRMQGVAGNPSYGYSLYELGVTDGGNPTNLAQGKTATASSEASDMQAAKAVDGDFTSRWAVSPAERSNPSSWIQVDLGQVQPVDRVYLGWESAAGQKYTIQTSTDGKTWTDAASYGSASTSMTAGGNWLDVDNRVGLVTRDSTEPISVVSGKGADQVVLAKGAATPLLVEGYAKTDSARTAQLAARAPVKTSDAALKASDADGYLSLFNLSGKQIDGKFTVPAAGASVSLFDGTQTLGSDTTAVQATLAAASSQLLAPRFSLTNADGSRPAAGITAQVTDAASVTLTGVAGQRATVRVTSAAGEAKDVTLDGATPVTVDFAGQTPYPLTDAAVGRTTFPTSPLPAGMGDPDLAVDGDGCTSWNPGANNARMVVDLGATHDLGTVRTVWTLGKVPNVKLSGSTDGVTYTPLATVPGKESALTTVSGSVRYLALQVTGWNKNAASLSTLSVYDAGTPAAVSDREMAVCSKDTAGVGLQLAAADTDQGAPWFDPVANPSATIESAGGLRLRYTVTNSGTVPLTGLSPTLDGAVVADCVRPDLAPGASYSCEFAITRATGKVHLATAVTGADPWDRTADAAVGADVVLTAPPTPPTPSGGGGSTGGGSHSGTTGGGGSAGGSGKGSHGTSGGGSSKGGSNVSAGDQVTPAPTPGAAALAAGGALVIDKSQLHAGDVLTATGDGFTPGERIDATIQDPSRSLGSYVADSGGNVTIEVLLPTTLDPGQYRLQLRGENSGRTEAASFTILDVKGEPAASVAPVAASDGDSGVPAWRWVASILAALLLAGAAVVVIVKRRRA